MRPTIMRIEISDAFCTSSGSEIAEPIKSYEHPRNCFLGNGYTGLGEIFRAYA